MSPTQIKCLAMAILLGAPEKQLFRGQLIYAAINGNRHADAIELLIAAAREELPSDWAGHCMQLAQWCFGQCADSSATPRKALLAALLDIAGRRHGADALDINAAVYLAAVHIDRGHSAAKAFAEGQMALQQALNHGRPAAGAASSGR